MYIPSKFKVDDPAVIHSFIRENSFGLLLSQEGNKIHDTHTPFTISEDGLLLGHIARANPQWKSWSECSSVKIIFTGPHSYISPQYYHSDFNVPTWNYTAVSVTGSLSIIEDEERVLDLLDDLVKHNEKGDSPWELNRDDERYTNLLSAIVAFSITMDCIETSFKLNQNKSIEDQASAIDSLQGTGCPIDKDVAAMMAANINNVDQEGNSNARKKN